MKNLEIAKKKILTRSVGNYNEHHSTVTSTGEDVFFLTVAVDWFNCSVIIMRLTLLFTLLVVGELRAANPDNQWVIFCNYCFTEVCHSELLRCCCSFEARDERRVTKRREGRKWGKTVEPMRSLWGPKFRYIRVITELLYQLTLIRFFKHIFPEKRNTKIKIYNK